jgi:hypothetical protein
LLQQFRPGELIAQSLFQFRNVPRLHKQPDCSFA